MRKTINFKENNNVVRTENIERYRIEMARQKTYTDEELAELITKAQCSAHGLSKWYASISISVSQTKAERSE